MVLIVAAPDSNAWMVAQADDIVDGFLTDILQTFCCHRICAASEHEVLPNQNAVFVTKVVEKIILVDAAAPDTEHIHVGIDRIEDCLFVALGGDTRQEVILWNVVGSFGKKRFAVQFEIERRSRFIFVANDAEAADADVSCFRVGNLSIHRDGGCERIEMRFAQTVCPP